jgi:RNA polymerase sigma-70 factor, ECF subfamily
VESERDLVLDLRARTPGAFERLYAAFADRVWRFLARLAGSAADDLFQETWLAVARHAHHLREDTRLLPWLFTVARNKHRNGLRASAHEAQRRRELGLVGGDGPAAPDEAAHALRQAHALQRAFSRLPDAHREVLLLCVVEGLDATDAAQALACSEAAVRKRLSRARAELARLAGRDAGERGDP